MAVQTGTKFDVGGVLLDRPFKIRRLNHFGFNNVQIEASLHFYADLLGFRVSDVLDFARMHPSGERLAGLGPTTGYLMRNGTDHHSFALFPRRVMEAMQPGRYRPGCTMNQLTWQVGSMREVVDGERWCRDQNIPLNRVGRDPYASNWHIYFFDPDGHQNELSYGIEQIGWDGYAKPSGQVYQATHALPDLPVAAELDEVATAFANGVSPTTGGHSSERLPARFDVEGVLLPRPFKIVRTGPIRLFVDDLAASERFYGEQLGLATTEEVVWQGHRCVFLRANTEHHTLALYPTALRERLGLSEHTACLSYGLQVGSYRQLRDALAFLGEQGVRIIELPQELRPGIDYAAYAIDPDGHALELYWYMEQVGWDGRPRPAAQRPRVEPGAWPEAVAALPDSYCGEPFLGPLG